ncbi:MAG: hypothetical protein Q9219_006245 [cf. Caloplaca sp. 3 TL-2023]
MASPMTSATMKSAVLTLCSALVATFLTPKNPPIVPLVIFAILATPPNFQWQQYIERKLPGYTVEKQETDGEAKGGTKAGGGVTVKKKLNIRNTITKVVLDQTVGAMVNVAFYIGGVRALQGVPLGACWQAVKQVRNHPSIASVHLWAQTVITNAHESGVKGANGLWKGQEDYDNHFKAILITCWDAFGNTIGDDFLLAVRIRQISAIVPLWRSNAFHPFEQAQTSSLF